MAATQPGDRSERVLAAAEHVRSDYCKRHRIEDMVVALEFHARKKRPDPATILQWLSKYFEGETRRLGEQGYVVSAFAARRPTLPSGADAQEAENYLNEHVRPPLEKAVASLQHALPHEPLFWFEQYFAKKWEEAAAKSGGAGVSKFEGSASRLRPFETPVTAGRSYFWCSCGKSENQPFCDGAHVDYNQEHGTFYEPVLREATEADKGVINFCGCKHTKTAPVCDMRHVALGETDHSECYPGDGVLLRRRSSHCLKTCAKNKSVDIEDLAPPVREEPASPLPPMDPSKVKPKMASTFAMYVDVEKGRSYQYCACGHSQSQPFCDGSHRAVNAEYGTSFKPTPFTPNRTGTEAFCGCRLSEQGPICDSSHMSIPRDSCLGVRAAYPQEFQPYRVTSMVQYNHDTCLIMMRGQGKATGDAVAASYHFSARLPATGVARPYTPVSYNARTNEVELLVKKVPDGAVSPFLCALKEGDSVELRGPSPGEYEVVHNKHKSLLLLAAGSGLTPILQILEAVCAEKTPSTSVYLVYSNKTEADILLRDSILRIQGDYPNVLKAVVLCVTRGTGDLAEPMYRGRISRHLLEEVFPKDLAKWGHAVVCGPPEFNRGIGHLLKYVGFQEDQVTKC